MQKGCSYFWRRRGFGQHNSMTIFCEQAQPLTIDDLRILARRVCGSTDARLDVTKNLHVENRNDKQQPIRRLTRLHVCWQIQPQRTQITSLKIRRCSQNNPTAKHLGLACEIRKSRSHKLADVFLNDWMLHGVNEPPNEKG